jgi:hypothetical protein
MKRFFQSQAEFAAVAIALTLGARSDESLLGCAPGQHQGHWRPQMRIIWPDNNAETEECQ